MLKFKSMASLEFKQKCFELRKQDFTLTEISKILNRSKTSVYFHIKNIPKSEIIRTKIKESNFKNFQKMRFLCPVIKGKSWKGRHCKDFVGWTPAIVGLVAHSIFDGELKRCGVIYNNRSVALIRNFRDKMKILYDFEPILAKDMNDVFRISYYSVELAHLFNRKSQELLELINSFRYELQKEFLKAFFDDEGCVTFERKKRMVRGYQHNDKILFLVQELLTNFDIESKVSTRFHEIIISRRNNLEKFAQKIDFSLGVKVNGKRSNSIWKQDLEKREILKMALASYL